MDKPKLPNEEELPYIDDINAAIYRKPRFGSIFLSITTIAIVIVFIIWSSWAEVDEVSNGQGKVIPSQRTQTIENFEGGILEELFVHEGQLVDKGTPLAKISNETSESQYRDALNKSYEQRAAIARLEAVLERKQPIFDEELQKKVPQIIQDQINIYNANIKNLNTEIEIAKAQYQQRIQELEEQKQRLKHTQESILLSKEQMQIFQSLVKRNLYSKVDFLRQKQEYIKLQSDQAAFLALIPKSEAAVKEAKNNVDYTLSEIQIQLTEEINKRRTELNSLNEILHAGSDRANRKILRSPVKGAVKQILLTTIGGVVKPGVPIMEIVPIGDTLLVEVEIRPSDIAFIRKNQEAIVKISAYDFSIYGGLHGKVEQISADTIEDQEGNVFYLVKIRTDKNIIVYRGKNLPIIPGMICVADILTGKKSILDFLIKPIIKTQQNALRER